MSRLIDVLIEEMAALIRRKTKTNLAVVMVLDDAGDLHVAAHGERRLLKQAPLILEYVAQELEDEEIEAVSRPH